MKFVFFIFYFLFMLVGIDASRANREIKTGVEWYSYYLIENLKKIDAKNHYFLYSEQKMKGGLQNLPSNWKSRILKWPLIFFWTQIRLSWEMLINPPNLLFVPSHVIPLIHPKKVITTIHDMGFKKFPAVYSFFQRWYQDFSVKFALKCATKIIVPSEFTKKELIEIYHADPEKIAVIHLACNDKIFRLNYNREKSVQILEKYNIKKPYLLFVGRLEEKKNISFLIDVFENLFLEEKPILVLVGKRGYGYKRINFLHNLFRTLSAPKSLKARQAICGIKDKIAKSRFRDRIIQISQIIEEDLAILYKEAKIFIFPSLYEGFGIPLLEAMATGAPVVASDSASIPEIVKDAALLSKPDDIKGFAIQIKKIWEDENLRNELKNKGLERVKNFSWRKCARETLDLFDLLSSKQKK